MKNFADWTFVLIIQQEKLQCYCFFFDGHCNMNRVVIKQNFPYTWIPNDPTAQLIYKKCYLYLFEDLRSSSWWFKTVELSWLQIQWKIFEIFKWQQFFFFMQKFIRAVKNYKRHWNDTYRMKITGLSHLQKRPLRGKRSDYKAYFSTAIFFSICKLINVIQFVLKCVFRIVFLHT